MVVFLQIEKKFLLNTDSFMKCCFKDNCLGHILSFHSILCFKSHLLAFVTHSLLHCVSDLTSLFILMHLKNGLVYLFLCKFFFFLTK